LGKIRRVREYREVRKEEGEGEVEGLEGEK